MSPEERRLAARIGVAIKRCRLQLGWSQATLAEHIDVSVNYVSLLERGQRLPAVGMLVTLSRILSTDVDALVGDEDADWVKMATRLLKGLRPAERQTVLAMLRGLARQDRKVGPRKR